MRDYLLIFLAFVLSSCAGYQQECLYRQDSLTTLSIPYVVGDVDGQFTSILAERVAASGAYQYVTNDGALLLKVEIVETTQENIGFRYDRHKDGELRDEIIPSETRTIIMADVTLYRNGGCEIALGPNRISASIDFDHDWYFVRRGANVFSLGQLTDIDSAEDAALRPLYEKLAEKIVDFLIYAW